MTHEEKIAAWVKSGELKIKDGKVTSAKIPMIHVGTQDQNIKGFVVPGIPVKTGPDGVAALELHSRNPKHQANLKTLGWKPYQVTTPPAGAEKATKTTTRKTATKKAD